MSKAVSFFHCFHAVPSVTVHIRAYGTPALGKNGYSLTYVVNGADNLNPNNLPVD